MIKRSWNASKRILSLFTNPFGSQNPSDNILLSYQKKGHVLPEAKTVVLKKGFLESKGWWWSPIWISISKLSGKCTRSCISLNGEHYRSVKNRKTENSWLLVPCSTKANCFCELRRQKIQTYEPCCSKERFAFIEYGTRSQEFSVYLFLADM